MLEDVMRGWLLCMQRQNRDLEMGEHGKEVNRGECYVYVCHC